MLSAFINLPYDRRYEKVYLAYIAGIVGYGMLPIVGVHDGSSRPQLDQVYERLARTQFSFHDLSWMSLTAKSPRTPRLNMAFELGLAVALGRTRGADHRWFVFDRIAHRLEKALSDLDGVEVCLYDGTPDGILRAFRKILVRKRQPTLAHLRAIYRDIEAIARTIKQEPAKTLFARGPFVDLVYVASAAADKYVRP
ncbi:MAG TPA: hypothetical protein VEO54_08700 [Thermoanaerobaculia bacterium]|nr:hypothetical protein [Thermoanaerobaculia bacterium]